MTKVKCDECDSEMLAEDFCACHKCYFKLVRENRELERKINAGVLCVKEADHSAGTPLVVRPSEGSVHQKRRA